MDKIHVLQYVMGTSLFTLILGYVVGRFVDLGKHRFLKTDRDLQLKGRVIAEEKLEKVEGKYIILKSMAKKGG